MQRRRMAAKKYTQKSVRARIEAFLLDHVGQVVTREQIQKVAADPKSGRVPENWLCGRHQVVKKNFWDHSTGKLNVLAIVQCAPKKVKREVYEFLREYFGD